MFFFPDSRLRAQSLSDSLQVDSQARVHWKDMTPATTCNSQFAGSIPHSTGIFTGKTHKNSSNTPTSESHNSHIQTLIRANFIPVEIRLRELSGDMLHDPF